jgi:hypothetical protein
MFVDYATFLMPIKVLIMVIEGDALPPNVYPSLKKWISYGDPCWLCGWILCGLLVDPRMRAVVLQKQPFLPGDA